MLDARTQPRLCEIAQIRNFLENENRSTEKRWRDNVKEEDMTKYQLTEDMTRDRKYWMIEIMDDPTHGDGHER